MWKNFIPQICKLFFDRSMEELCPSMTTLPVIQNGGVPNVQSTVQSRIICCPQYLAKLLCFRHLVCLFTKNKHYFYMADEQNQERAEIYVLSIVTTEADRDTVLREKLFELSD